MRIFFIALLLSFLFLKVKAQETTLACRDLENLYIAAQDALPENEIQEIEKTKDHYCSIDPEKIRIGMSLQYSNGQLVVDALGIVGAQWYLPNGQEIDIDLFRDIFSERKVAPILAPFKKYHAICSGNCDYISWGIWGDEAHKKRPSCHNSGEAIDIHAIKCGKTISKPQTKKYKNYLQCMRKHFGVVHGNAAHKNHAHIQLKNCRKIKLK